MVTLTIAQGREGPPGGGYEQHGQEHKAERGRQEEGTSSTARSTRQRGAARRRVRAARPGAQGREGPPGGGYEQHGQEHKAESVCDKDMLVINSW